MAASNIYKGPRRGQSSNTKPYDYGLEYVDISKYSESLVKRLKGNKLYKLKKYKARPLYKYTETFGEERKHLPYDYKETLLSKMLSPYIYRKRDVNAFLEFVNDWIVSLLQGVGKLKILKNFTVDKDYKYIK
tara:strand:+ start:1330 stop:1725 length:396 start_codon:yes stop_codon:yes gene_type:complete